MLRHGAGSVDRLPVGLWVSAGRSWLRRPAPSVAASGYAASGRAADVAYCPYTQQLLSAVAFTAAKFCSSEATAADPDVLAAIQALAESYKTLGWGIVYQKPPIIPVQRQLYKALAAFLTETKQPAGHSSLGAFKDSEVFQLLVFLFRMGLMRTNGRPRSRRSIEFLRRQFPGAQEWQKEESRIIVP